ncbi:MAG TPA: ABC transporter ATP-binding protein, partial [Devosia sp.]|nr:ABC transporter ATP-binding protein [Devosia sp.]
MATARKFLSYYRPHLPLLLADLLCALLVAATALALPLCANYVTKSLIDLPEVPQALSQIYLMGALMLAMLAIQVLAVFFVDYQGHVMGARIESTLRKQLFEHCQKLSFSFYDRQRVGQLMSRITNDSLWLGELYHHGPEDLAIAVLKFGGALLILAFIDPVLTALIAGLTPFAVLDALYFNRRMGQAMQASKERIAGVNERVEDSLAGIRVVQSFANEAVETHRFDRANE